MNQSHRDFFIEIASAQRFKHGQMVCGDTLISRKIPAQQRLVSVLSDGLGSGIKANVLSSLTASMAMKYATHKRDLMHAAETIMRTLPMDTLRKISYATFSIIDVEMDGQCSIVEYDNPPAIVLRKGEVLQLPITTSSGVLDQSRTYDLHYRSIKLQEGDTVIFFSDGVSQSGMGYPRFPFGWEECGVIDFVQFTLQRQPTISARALAAQIVEHAFANCHYKAADDITCAVINVRKPRRLLVTTGPSVEPSRDARMAQQVAHFDGQTAICGGTTATIVARELNRKVTLDIAALDPDVPCTSHMDGVDLVTEGMITLAKVIELLETDMPYEEMKRANGAVKLIELFQESDIIEFMVGTKINEVHQDPTMPLELGIRRNSIKSLARLLEEKLLKEVKITYV